VRLNGRTVPATRVAISMATDSLRWRTGDVRVITIGPADDPWQVIGAVFVEQRGDALVLVNPKHRDFFERARGFLSGPGRGVQRRGGNARVLVLTGDAAARTYQVDATAAVEPVAAANVVGVVPGRRRDQMVVFSAHYDHVGVQRPVDGDSIANGANDDASGTTAVIELARYFKASGTPERTLVFVAFTAEEAGGFGSQYFSRQLDPGQIVAMFNIEMIGKPAASGRNHAWITGFERSSLGKMMQDAARGTDYVFEPDPYPQENLFYRSDNATLARLGVPAHTISTTPIDVDQDYHRVSDEVRTLDLDHLTGTIRAIATGAATIVSGAATPTRVDTTRLR
jgi:Zn-dependent M28 family amino/carboxypeptidase